jgi:hypothetical protein
MRFAKFLVFAVLFLFIFAAVLKASSLYGWVIYKNAPIYLPIRAVEGNNIYAPDVHKEGAVWKMWYGGQSLEDLHDRILYAISSDGITWTYKGTVIQNNDIVNGNPVLNNDPSVVKVNSTYYMYYDERYAHDRIMLATSTDGVNWTKKGVVIDVTANQWGTGSAARPSVLYENGIFKVWYDSKDAATGIRSVGYATSSDGIHFTKYAGNPVLLNAGAVDVKHVGSIYVMLIESTSGIYFAQSPDETHFVNKGLLFTKTGTAVDSRANVTPMLYLDSMGVPNRVYFGGGTALTANRIFMASGGTIPNLLATPIPSPTPTPIKTGDVNGDGVVNILDIGMIIDNYAKLPITNPAADLNHDGVVNILDIGIVIDNYGK